MKVVLDSNVLISAFAAKGRCADLFREVVSTHELMISDYILDEVTEKLAGKIKIPASTVVDIRALLLPFLVAGLGEADVDAVIRDPDDVPIVAFAVASSADILITGDRDLLDVAGELPVKVISPREYFEL